MVSGLSKASIWRIPGHQCVIKMQLPSCNPRARPFILRPDMWKHRLLHFSGSVKFILFPLINLFTRAPSYFAWGWHKPRMGCMKQHDAETRCPSSLQKGLVLLTKSEIKIYHWSRFTACVGVGVPLVWRGRRWIIQRQHAGNEIVQGGKMILREAEEGRKR